MEKNGFDIVTIGDCSIDAFFEIHEASLHCKLNRKSCELCFKYGDKIPIESLEFAVGGNAANTSVGFSRFGLKTGIISRIGTDELSSKIINTLKKEEVDTNFIQKDVGTTSNFSASINFKGERTLFTYHVKRNQELNSIPSSKWIYLTSIGDYWQEVYSETCRFVREKEVLLAFSPGSHQIEGEPTLLKQALSCSTVLLINLNEAKRIVGTRTGNVNKLLTELKKLGPKIASITDGINGSWSILEDGRILKIEVFPCDTIERTGAGDAYACGFMAAFIAGLPISQAMAWGAVNGASVIERTGAQKGLLTRGEIEEKLKSRPGFVGKEI